MELQKTKDISYALKTIEGHFPAAFRPVAASPRQAEPQATGYRQVRIDPLTNPVLLGYLKERGILPEIAREACKEVHFQNKGKWYFAVGFANRSGGYEIRNKYLKGSISPKEITATSVEPPPMSTTILPQGSPTGNPAPIAAAIGSSIK